MPPSSDDKGTVEDIARYRLQCAEQEIHDAELLYVKEGEFPKDYGRKIAMAENMRHKSDYADYYFATKEDAEEQLIFAREFLCAVRKYLFS